MTWQGGELSQFFWQIALINDNVGEELFLNNVYCFTDADVRLGRFFLFKGGQTNGFDTGQ